MKKVFRPASIRNIEVTDPLFGSYMKRVSDKIIPYQWEILNDRIADAEKSWCLENFRIAAGEKPGRHRGAVFVDTDAYKWLETVAYCFENGSCDDWIGTADQLIDLIGRAQEPDGYLNTYYSIEHPDRKWTNLAEGHELYCAGHLLEAAVAWRNATGKDNLLRIAMNLADLICRVFDAGGPMAAGCPGHPEVELALVKLYQATDRKAYLDLALHFLQVRGRKPNYLMEELKGQGEYRIFPEFKDYDDAYAQAHLPPTEQRTAEGHAVRAMYLYSAMADLASGGEAALATACEAIWNNLTKRRMYITGGIGASAHLERFTTDFDLPNDTMYCESCASVGLMMFGLRMAALTGRASYFESVERALCNTVLGGISATGDRYFYVNPLEVWPARCLPATAMAHVKPVRQAWFNVACCPTNIARTLASLGQYIYGIGAESPAKGDPFGTGKTAAAAKAVDGFSDASRHRIYVNLFISSGIRIDEEGTDARIDMASTFMQDGRIRFTVSTKKPLTIFVRIPSWFSNPSLLFQGDPMELSMDEGYAAVRLPAGEALSLVLKGQVAPAFFAANREVRADAGRIALTMGPYVYCLEEMDNGANLDNLFVKPDAEVTVSGSEESLPGLLPTLTFAGERIIKSIQEEDALYGTPQFERASARLSAIPYGLWNNRTPGEMCLWLKALL